MELLNDVHSGLNPTPVAAVAHPRCLADLKLLVGRAARDGRPVSLAGGRHAMGASVPVRLLRGAKTTLN